jgi:indolepyruvate ferredoxin oxidoreductase
MTCGKSYMDVRQALQYLGIDETEAVRLGLRIYKVGMTWPLEPQGALKFARGLNKVLVVEEKRSLIESQLKEICYGQPGMPQVIGKRDEHGEQLFQSNAALDPNEIAIAIGRRILEYGSDSLLANRVAEQEQLAVRLPEKPAMERTPYFCSGCPHSSGTRVPEGSRALSGIGCHFMAQWMDRNTAGYTQMGAEGASWIGEAPFVKTRHVFQNIGDGTYFHSGLLALRASVASGVNVTYKILYNDAVAMTGGQHVDGNLSVPQVAAQVLAEGAKKVAVVTDEPEKYGANAGFPPNVEVHHRDDYDRVQREMREIEGCTVIIYDQTCAAEKRRRRKRNLYPDPPKRVLINDLVCEGCGDCQVKSNCVSVLPLDTEYGRKRTIDQSSCNKDYSCVKGFCPSFVTVHGGSLRKGKAVANGEQGSASDPALPQPQLPSLETPYGMLVTGVGGTGVVTIGAILGMAAHIEGRGFAALDMAGLAQKGGAVWSHVQIAAHSDDIKTVRLGSGGAKLVLGCDLVVSASQKTMDTTRPGHTRMVVNTNQQMTGDFTRNVNFQFPGQALKRTIMRGVGEEQADFVDASRIATTLMGDSIATNMFMLGYAYQKGLVPISADAINKAIELNRAAVKMNQAAFLWGRRAAFDLASVERLVSPKTEQQASTKLSQSLEELIERRAEFLTAYQDARYADQYRKLVERVRQTEAAKAKGLSGLAQAVARYYFKLLAYKDEYEVARLHTQTGFQERIRAQFEGDYRVHFHLAPPLFSKRDPVTGELKKREYGPWIYKAFKLLAQLRRLRGTPFDIFGYTEERRIERQLIVDYEALVEEILVRLKPENHAIAVQLAAVPEDIRGYGHIKMRNLEPARAKQAKLLAAFRSPEETRAAA